MREEWLLAWLFLLAYKWIRHDNGWEKVIVLPCSISWVEYKMSHSRMPTHCTLHAFSPQHHPLKNDLNIHIKHGHQSTIQRQPWIRSLFCASKVIPPILSIAKCKSLALQKKASTMSTSLQLLALRIQNAFIFLQWGKICLINKKSVKFLHSRVCVVLLRFMWKNKYFLIR